MDQQTIQTLALLGGPLVMLFGLVVHNPNAANDREYERFERNLFRSLFSENRRKTQRGGIKFRPFGHSQGPF